MFQIGNFDKKKLEKIKFYLEDAQDAWIVRVKKIMPDFPGNLYSNSGFFWGRIRSQKFGIVSSFTTKCNILLDFWQFW